MPVESEIREKLLQGHTPQELIQEGYRKSTVYKAYGATKTHLIPIAPTTWSVHNANFSTMRYAPGQQISVGFTLRNESPLDLYIYRTGVKTEWMRGNWQAQEVRELVKGGGQRWFNFTLPVPRDLALGEYELLYGIEGQHLPASVSQPIQLQWSEPTILEIKKPKRGLRIFLSHSTEDMTVVRQLETSLDNEGIEVMIAEDRLEPGTVLLDKVQRMIRESSLVLALLTDSGVRSEWVIKEVDFAFQIQKPCVLLKEESVRLDTQREWVKFSRNDSPEVLFQKVMEAVTAVQPRTDVVGAIIAIGVLALLAGALSESR